MITLNLTKEQAEQLAKIIDAATQGIQNAAITMPLYNLLMQAAQESLETLEPPKNNQPEDNNNV